MNGAAAHIERIRRAPGARTLTAVVATVLGLMLLASSAAAQPTNSNLPSAPSAFPPGGGLTPQGLDQHVSIPASALTTDFKRVVLGKKAVYKLCPTCSNIDVGSGSATDVALQQLQLALAQAEQERAKLNQMLAAVEKSEADRQQWLDALAAKLLGVAQQLAHKSHASYKESAKPGSAEDAVDNRMLYVCKQVGAACQ